MPKFKDGAETRKARLHKLLEIIGNHPDVDEVKIKGVFMLQTGLTRAKIDEYIEDLECTGLIIRENDKIRVTC